MQADRFCLFDGNSNRCVPNLKTFLIRQKQPSAVLANGSWNAAPFLPLPLSCFSPADLSALKNEATLNSIHSIQKRIALFLLVVFALSATPKAFFHDVLAKHSDGIVCTETDKSSPHFHHPAFHCSFDDLVVTSPFVSLSIDEAPEHAAVYAVAATGFTAFIPSSPFLHKESRGPPLTWFPFQSLLPRIWND